MRLLTLLFSFLIAAGAAAQQQPGATQQQSPEELVKQVTNDVLGTIKSDKQLQSGDKKKALELAEQKILPHVDFRASASMAAGQAWRQATPEQKDQITKEFRSMLIRIYSNAIGVYQGQTMKVLPVRTTPTATETTVRNQYMKPGERPVIVEYVMHKTDNGWQIYDIVVEGVSLVLTFRSEFDQIAKTAGVDGLIKKMQEKNA
jgi:phospholipid transport system substrate-binding protein